MEVYAHRWASTIKNIEEWHRDESQREHPDRLWIHKYAKEPVLDVGCGTCLSAEPFKDYVGIDVTRAFLEVAHLSYGVKNVIRCDAQYLPFKDKVFETAFSKGLLLHYLQKVAIKIIWEMLRVSKTTIIAWGIVKWSPHKRVNYLPSYKPFISMRSSGFYYNRHDLAELEKHFEVILVGEGTSITIIEEK